MKTCLVHTCYDPQLGEQYDKKKCKCRKMIRQSPNESDKNEPCAEVLLRHGWAVPHMPERFETGRTQTRQCEFCLGDKIMARSCDNCGKAGTITNPIYTFKYAGNIVLTQEASVNAAGEVEISTSRQQKTTRVDGLTRADVERALGCNGAAAQVEAQQKIETWGVSAMQVIAELMVPFRPCPFEGRVILYSPAADERTSKGIDKS